MARSKPWEISDELWAIVNPLRPKVKRRFPHAGRKRHGDRLVLRGILFVLHTGIAWEHLPQELGFGSGMTCWRRLAEWHEAGERVFALLHHFRRLRIRWEIRDDIHEALLSLGGVLICWRRLASLR